MALPHAKCNNNYKARTLCGGDWLCCLCVRMRQPLSRPRDRPLSCRPARRRRHCPGPCLETPAPAAAAAAALDAPAVHWRRVDTEGLAQHDRHPGPEQLRGRRRLQSAVQRAGLFAHGAGHDRQTAGCDVTVMIVAFTDYCKKPTQFKTIFINDKERTKDQLAATLWWFTAVPKPLKYKFFLGSPSPQGSYSPYILRDTTRPGHVTCVLV